MEEREAAALGQAAKQLLTDTGDLAEVEAALSTPVSLDQVETVRMNRPTRLFTYATCFWMRR